MEGRIVRNSVFPVVVVGKDRTRMTCEVVRNIQRHIVNQSPYFIIVSDRSREGHGEAIRDFCQKEVSCGWEYLETTAERYGWGAAIDIGLEEAWKISDVAMVVDNDWILQRDIDADRTRDCLMDSSVGCISYKHIGEGTNIETDEYSYYNDIYLSRSEKDDSERPSYVVEIGCMTISQRFFDEVGHFLENVNNTDDVEHDFIRRYRNIPRKDREVHRILFATPKEYLHSRLNGEGHVFTHIGMESQSGRIQTWGIPAEYADLNDKAKDEEHCRTFVLGKSEIKNPKVALVAIAKDEDKYIDEWIGYHFKLGFDEIFIYQNDWRYSGENLNHPKVHWLVADGKCQQSESYNRFIGKHSGDFDFAAFFDIDEFLYVKNGHSIGEFLSGHVDSPGIAVNWRLFGDNGIVELQDGDDASVLRRFTKCGSKLHDVVKIIVNLRKIPLEARFGYAHQMFVGESEYPISDPLGKKMSKHGRIAGNTHDEPVELFHFRNKTLQENIQRHLGKCNPNEEDMPNEHESIDSVKKIFEEYNENEIENTTARDFMYPSKEDMWKRNFDRIYCFHYIPQSEKMGRLEKELRRTGILDSGIFEFRKTVPVVYEKKLFQEEQGPACRNEWCVNLALETLRVLKEADLLGYERILILEDDVAFLRDIDFIFRMLSAWPDGYDCLQLDKFTSPNQSGSQYRSDLSSGRINDFFFEKEGVQYTSASCVALNRAGIKAWEEVLEKNLVANDLIYRYAKCKTAVAIRNACIQIVYGNCCNLKIGKLSYIHGCYSGQGIEYSDYSVPEGYGEGSLITEDGMVKGGDERKIGNKCKGRKKISVYAIAKNESHLVEKWMSSMSEADEVVVLDTGSTDDTVEHLRRLGARVEVEKFDSWKSAREYDDIVARGGNPWRFDKARNDSMALVSEDADILVTTDIDEFIQPGWREKLEEQWIAAEERGENPSCAAYKYVWCYNPDGTEARTFEIHKIHRRNVCTWTHMIHEVLHYHDGDRPVCLKDFTVEHHQDFSKSRTSYLPMLEVSARDNPENDRDAHYYGRELMYAGRWDDAVTELKRHLSLRSAAWRAERASSMRYIANCYSQKGNDELWELWMLKAMEEDPNHREASFNLGLHYMGKKDYKSAGIVLEKCLDIKTNTQEYICDGRCWTAKPYILMSQACWWNGDWARAERIVGEAVAKYPDDEEAKKQLNGMSDTRKKYNR